MLTEPITTARLHIRPFVADDWHALSAITSDPTTMAFRPEGQMSAVQARDFVSEQLGNERKSYAVDLLQENRLIGQMDFHPWFGARTYEIGWLIDPRHQGQGYATEAAAALLRYGFETLHLHRIIATCQPENPASWRVMEKLGMRREAHFRKGHLHNGDTWWDEFFYAILADEWFPSQ